MNNTAKTLPSAKYFPILHNTIKLTSICHYIKNMAKRAKKGYHSLNSRQFIQYNTMGEWYNRCRWRKAHPKSMQQLIFYNCIKVQKFLYIILNAIFVTIVFITKKLKITFLNVNYSLGKTSEKWIKKLWRLQPSKISLNLRTHNYFMCSYRIRTCILYNIAKLALSSV